MHKIEREDDVARRLQDALDTLPDGIEALDASAIDGYLVGLVLQRVPLTRAFTPLLDPDETGHPTPNHPAVDRIEALASERWHQLDSAIEARQWFDPWIFAPEEADEPPSQTCAPWAAGFALAMHHVPGLMEIDAAQTIDALALIYVHFDPNDLEDADELLEHIAAMEPAGTLDDAVEDLVSATLLLADVVRPLREGLPQRSPRRRRGMAAKPRHASPAPRRGRGTTPRR